MKIPIACSFIKYFYEEFYEFIKVDENPQFTVVNPPRPSKLKLNRCLPNLNFRTKSFWPFLYKNPLLSIYGFMISTILSVGFLSSIVFVRDGGLHIVQRVVAW
ncbi:hypothetical protein [Epilithonimonas lactis]|uniref:hypothetical protein n=1 Tax=Epilithonimonas lactis TaxID=421072 RepID=UPI00103C59F7|nr:hypothetical protein [Epilithonimonas lactis]